MVVGTLLFVVAVIVFAIIMIALVDLERPGWATISVVAALGLFGWLGDVNILLAIKNHPVISGILFFSYFLAGTLWMFVKWYFYVRGAKEKYLEIKAIRTQQGAEDSYAFIGTPKVESHQALLMTWMLHWPFSLFWTLINDPVKKIFLEIFRRIKGTLQRMSDDAFADVSEDLQKSSSSAEKDSQ